MTKPQVTFRHMSSSQELQQIATDAVVKLDKYCDNITNIDVIFTQDVACIVEIYLSVQGSTLISKEQSEDFSKSLNSAIDKLIRQIRKQKTKDTKSKTTGLEY